MAVTDHWEHDDRGEEGSYGAARRGGRGRGKGGSRVEPYARGGITKRKGGKGKGKGRGKGKGERPKYA